MDASIPETAARIQSLLCPLIGNPEGVARQQDLQELGLTSMQMVNLMLSIEAEFNLTIPTTKLVPSNFRTIESIETLVQELRH
ncbi:MAG: phosphopantetheine-binding protein [Methylocystis sp.]|uniref:phosphopantetheine-binding protein n=1 Tax=Methylocystis sp. TaxID=1911079 RepID=UPI003DA3F39B